MSCHNLISQVQNKNKLLYCFTKSTKYILITVLPTSEILKQEKFF